MDNQNIWIVRNRGEGEAKFNDYLIPSEDGAVVYRFDKNGRHLQTVDAVTKTPIYTFAYDSNGLLVTITDADGDVTQINRDTGGQAQSIVAADGQETHLTPNANGFISQITDAADQTYQMGYTTRGLLTHYTDPRGNVSTYEYDAQGLLLKDHAPTGGGWTLARTNTDKGHEVSLTSGEGRVQQFKVERDSPRRIDTHQPQQRRPDDGFHRKR